MSQTIDGYCEVYVNERPRAKKEHRCAACRETIKPGHIYNRLRSIFQGEPRTVKRCLRCQVIHEHLVKQRGQSWDEWPDEYLDCEHEYEEIHGHAPPPEIAALAFALPHELQQEQP